MTYDKWDVCLSTGGTTDFTCYRLQLGTGRTDFIVADFNGDGRADLASFISGTSWTVCLATGVTTASQRAVKVLPTPGWPTKIAERVGTRPIEVTSRSWIDDAGATRGESFGYDSVNRLTSVSGPTSKTYAYDDRGNITSKDGLTYNYGVNSNRLISITGTVGGAVNPAPSYDANGNVLVSYGYGLSWTSFNMPSQVSGPGVTETFLYGPEHQRVRQIDGQSTSYYAGGGYEKQVYSAGAKLVHTVGLPGGTQFLVVTDVASSTTSVVYQHPDHLGSPVAITDAGGVVIKRRNYNAWGQPRQNDGTEVTPVAWPSGVHDRGYTGHETLDARLVHMNGRLYDPLIARFVSADPFVQDPDNLQSYGRYAYVGNDPLTFVDPSGYFKLKKLIRAVVAIAVAWYVPQLVSSYITSSAGASAAAGSLGAEIGASSAYAAGSAAAGAATSTSIIAGAAGGFSSALVASGGDLRSAAVGALTGGAFGYAGTLSASESYLAHAGAGCASGALGGGGCGRGAASAVAGKYATNYSEGNFVAAVVVGGTVSEISGGKFENGAVTAAFGYLFNHCGPRSGNDCLSRIRESLSDSPVGQLWSSVFGSPRETELVQRSLTVGGTVMYGVGVSVEAGPVSDSSGKACFALTLCGLAGPGAGVTFDRSVSFSMGSPSSDPGASIAVFGKWAVPLAGGYEFAPGYGSDGLTFQIGRSRGIFSGGGVKACVQMPMKNSTGGPC